MPSDGKSSHDPLHQMS